MVKGIRYVLHKPTPIETEELTKLSPAQKGHPQHTDRI